MWKIEQTEVTTASPDAIWDVITDIDRWSRWNPGVRASHLDGPIQAGSSGRLTLPNGRRLGFTLEEAKAQSSLVFAVSWPGLHQRFLYTIAPTLTSGARVSMAATMTGPLAPILSRLVGRVIGRNLPVAVQQLVAAAEGSRDR
jgi:uncharacterized protein YndB with AHSA1/START domain